MYRGLNLYRQHFFVSNDNCTQMKNVLIAVRSVQKLVTFSAKHR